MSSSIPALFSGLSFDQTPLISRCEGQRARCQDQSTKTVVKRLTRMPVCVDPSHAVGSRTSGPEGILDLMHATAQGVIAGANMVLVDFHPAPNRARSRWPAGPSARRIAATPQGCADSSRGL